jgi:hypothetical protein
VHIVCYRVTFFKSLDCLLPFSLLAEEMRKENSIRIYHPLVKIPSATLRHNIGEFEEDTVIFLKCRYFSIIQSPCARLAASPFSAENDKNPN